MQKFKKYSIYLVVAVICAGMNNFFPTFIPQLILYLLVVWRIEDGAR